MGKVGGSFWEREPASCQAGCFRLESHCRSGHAGRRGEKLVSNWIYYSRLLLEYSRQQRGIPLGDKRFAADIFHMGSEFIFRGTIVLWNHPGVKRNEEGYPYFRVDKQQGTEAGLGAAPTPQGWVVAFIYFLIFIWFHQVLVAACGIFDLCCGRRTLSCNMWDLVPWPGIEPGPSALGAQSLSHWTTREVPVGGLQISFKI